MGKEAKAKQERKILRHELQERRGWRRAVLLPVGLFLIMGAGVAIQLYLRDSGGMNNTSNNSANIANNVPTDATSTPTSPGEQTAHAKIALIKTDAGDIKVELFGADAPKTVDNFAKLAKEGLYKGTTWHRVV